MLASRACLHVLVVLIHGGVPPFAVLQTVCGWGPGDGDVNIVWGFRFLFFKQSWYVAVAVCLAGGWVGGRAGWHGRLARLAACYWTPKLLQEVASLRVPSQRSLRCKGTPLRC